MKRFNYKRRFVGNIGKLFFLVMLCTISMQEVYAQCTPVSSTISGRTFYDNNYNGTFDEGDTALSGVRVVAFDGEGRTAGSMISDSDGTYSLRGLTDATIYKVVFTDATGNKVSKLGVDNASPVQFVTVPSCNISVGYYNNQGNNCSEESQIALTCFVNGPVDGNAASPTIVGNKYGFSEGSPVSMYANHGQTGSIWGMTYGHTEKVIYSSAFVKQYAGLKAGPYAIFGTKLDGDKSTSQLVDVSTLGANIKGLTVSDIDDCGFGTQVGRIGLGGLDISHDGSTLYTIVLDNNELVALPTKNPTTENTQVYAIPRPVNIADNEEFRAFAVHVGADAIYIGVTVTGSVTKQDSNSMAIVYKFDESQKSFSEVFRTNYLKGIWQDSFTSSYKTSHWFTDIDFTDDGHMIISLTDRVGHRYCKEGVRRVDQQFPDILMVGYDRATDTYRLESNGSVAGLTGSGVDNGQGPNGGEFFGKDYFPGNPEYHSEVALGSVVVLPGTNSVVAAVYDPLNNTYSGGLHRYSTKDGSLLGGKELYVDNYNVAFGKATGFGDITVLCGDSEIEIGNYVWYDDNANGTQDANEEGVPGVEVKLYDASCTLIGTTTTDANGRYLFNADNADVAILAGHKYYILVGQNIFSANTGLYELKGSGYSITKPNKSQSYDDSNALSTGCEDKPAIEVVTSSNDYTYDVGFTISNDFDLALKKEVKGDPYVRLNDIVTFDITVYNQGAVAGKNIVINDHLPSGYAFIPSLNEGWTKEGNVLKYTITEVLLPSNYITVPVSLRVLSSPTLDYVNVAEIGGATDVDGNPVTDIDSTPDDNPTNDTGGEVNGDTDNDLSGDGTKDEDDHDPASIKVFDLALMIDHVDNRIYYNNEPVEFDITVFNQGNVDARLFDVTNYIPDELRFYTSDNPGWEFSKGLPTFKDTKVLKAGESRTYRVLFRIAKFNQVADIVNYAEISRSIPVGKDLSYDFDSTPDLIPDNDNGGVPVSATDNTVTSDPSIDEDDHDPVLIRTKFYDLAMIKMVDKKRVKAGDEVTYTIELYNQGTAAVSQVTLIDYLPEGLTVTDPSWTVYQGSKYTKSLVFSAPFLPGSKHVETLTAVVNENAKEGMLMNYAEIMSFKGEGGSGASDVDSDPDDNSANDAGGTVNTNTDNKIDGTIAVDEDDHDPAALVVVSTGIETTCLSNATNAVDGQFKDVFTLVSGSGATWTVDEVQGYYDVSSAAPPAAPTPLALGGTMTEEITGDTLISNYKFEAIRIDDKPAYIRFRSNEDDLEVFQTGGSKYKDIVVEGQRAMCGGTLLTYTITNADPSAVYTWTLPDGGTATPTEGSTVEIDWSATATGTSYTVEVAAADACTAPLSFEVVNGDVGSAMTCNKLTYVSLDANCQALIHPGAVVPSTDPNVGSYTVMVMDTKGAVIPEATVTGEHLGQTLEVKVFDACGVNHCWGHIKVEDKIKPEILCTDVIELECNKLDEYEGPFATDNCSGIVMEVETSVVPSHLYCDDNYVGSVTRRYVAVDDYGNQSEPCEVTIKLKRPDMTAITEPEDFTMLRGTALSCGEFATDDKGNPHVSVTGSPMYNGDALVPQFDNPFCHLTATYVDEESVINGVRKIIRTFYVYESHCTSTTPWTYEQSIDIVDNVAPVINKCPEDVVIGTTVPDCMGRVELQLPEAKDACGSVTNIRISYGTGEFIDHAEREDVSKWVSFPYSETPYEIMYFVLDEAGNESTCSSFVTVRDDVAPIAACAKNTVVSVTVNGEGYLDAEDIDQGSYDYCSDVSFLIRRMNAAQCDPTARTFQERLKFCCEDVGTQVMVELQVKDAAGNINSCMVEVSVTDKISPEVIPPAPVTIDCGDSYTPLSQFGAPTITDNCTYTLSVDSTFNVSGCGTGSITRTFTVTDGTNTSVATQVITIINSSPFDPKTIMWPPNYDTTGECNAELLKPELLPSPYGYPTFTEDQCDMVGATYEDEIFDFAFGTEKNCYKILRRWKVLDWCLYDSDPSYEAAIHTQVIKVYNDVDPTITYTPLGDIVTTNCDNQTIVFRSTGQDDCTPVEGLKYTVHIDINRDGLATETYDHTYTGTGGTTFHTRSLPLGEHAVVYTYEDACGNQVSEVDLFSVKTNKGATVTCKDISVGLTPMDMNGDGVLDSEMAMLCVDSLSTPSTFHPCGLDYTLSFSPDAIVKKDTVDCDDLGVITRTVYAIDASGNVTSCNSTIEVQDNNDADICINIEDCITCPTPSTTVNADANCAYVHSGASLDPQLISSECGTLTITHDFASAPSNTSLDGTTFGLGTHTITWTVMDVNGRSKTCTVELMVEDTTNPIITCAESQSFTDSSDGQVNCSYTNSGTGLDATATDNCGVVSLTHDYGTPNTTLAGTSFPVGTTTVTWTAVDAAGNTSSCTTVVTVTDSDGPALQCGASSDLTVSADGTNDCLYTVSDNTLDAVAIDLCGTVATLTHDYNGGGTTLSGQTFAPGTHTINWVATDDSNNSVSCVQTITVVDDLAPQIECVGDMAIGEATDGVADCQYTVPDSSLDASGSDNCSHTITHDFTNAPNNTTLAGTVFPVGEHTITWTVTDGVNDPVTCQTVITVSDDQGPACPDNNTIEVAIPMSGTYTITEADLPALPTDLCASNVTISLTPVDVTCENVGQTVQVSYTASDGVNTTTCVLNVSVMENIVAECNPIDITVVLDQTGSVTITPDMVNNANASMCGSVPDVVISENTFDCNDLGDNVVTITVTNGGNMSTCTAVVTVTDTLHGPTIVNCPTAFEISCEDYHSIHGGVLANLLGAVSQDFDIDDNCPEMPANPYVRDTSIVNGLNDCGYGKVFRQIVVTDPMSSMSDTCTQIITITDPALKVDQTYVDGLVPSDVTVNCEDAGDLNPNPTIGEITAANFTQFGACSSIGFAFNDVPQGQACGDTLFRTWTVVDTCQLSSTDPSAGIFNTLQKIVLVDNVPPVISGVVDTVIVLDSICTVDLDFSSLISVTDCSTVTATNNGAGATNQNSIDPSGTYEAGTYEVVLTAMDVCGNMAADTMNIDIQISAALFSCLKLQWTVDSTLMFSFSSNDLLKNGDCLEGSQFATSFSPDDLTDTTKVVDCSTVTQSFLVYFFENGVLLDSCKSEIEYTDPNNLCPTALVGNVQDMQGRPVSDFAVNFYGDETITAMTNASGNYEFPRSPINGNSVMAMSEADVRKGVSIIDMIKIQRHLMGVEKMNNPYQLFAADVNRDNNVNAADIFEMRKLLLYLTDAFENNSSWRGIPADATFDNPLKPWNGYLGDMKDIANVSSNNIDFIGVKVGDVDNSQAEGVERRSNAVLYMQQRMLQDGVNRIPLYMDGDDEVYGLQLTLDISKAQLVAVESDVIDVNDISFSAMDERGHIIVTLPEGAIVKKDSPLLTLVVNSASRAMVSECISLADSDNVIAKGHTSGDVSTVSLEVRNVYGEAEFVAKQNNPNPWSNHTKIEIALPTDGEVSMTIYDVTGKEISSRTVHFSAGKHTLVVDGDDVLGTGVYYYEIEYNGVSTRNKMIRLK